MFLDRHGFRQEAAAWCYFFEEKVWQMIGKLAWWDLQKKQGLFYIYRPYQIKINHK